MLNVLFTGKLFTIVYNVGRNLIVHVCVPVLHVHVCLYVCKREEGSDHAAIIKLSPWLKVAGSNENVFLIN